MKNTPKCPYCGKPSKQVTGAEIFCGFKKMQDKIFYECLPCDARVGCHKDTDTPMGMLANRELRELRVKTHKVFDWIWQNPHITHMHRPFAYIWLSRYMRMHKTDCHIGLFSELECLRVIRIVEEYRDYYGY